MNHIFRLAGVLLPMAALMACGGGGSSGGGGGGSAGPAYLFNAVEARTTAGGSNPPNLSASQIESTVQQRTRAADTLLVTDVTASTSAGLSRHTTTCSGRTCTTPDLSVTFSLDNPPFGNAPGDRFNAQPVMTKNGVTTAQAVSVGRSGNTISTVLTYGGWLDGSVFGVQGDYTEENGQRIGSAGVGLSTGKASGSNPAGTGSATWQGLMIGGTRQEAHIIQGDATIDIDDLSSPDVDIAFTNIRNLNTGANITSMSWDGVTVTNGRFSSNTGSLEGSFYGTSHEEVGGVFDRNDIIGGFGGARQSP